MGGVAVKRQKRDPTPDACRNCVFSRKGFFELKSGKQPGYKCFRDGRTHDPDACCGAHRRRGRIMKQNTIPKKEGLNADSNEHD